MNPDHYNAVREAVVKAVPEILELKFGCRVEGFIPQDGEPSDSIEYTPDFTDIGMVTNSEYLQIDGRFGDILVEDLKKDIDYYCEEDGFSFEILGRPIRLGDILLAVNGKNGRGYHFMRSTGEFGTDEGYNGMSDKGVFWNLSKDRLEDQSPETIEFLYELLQRS